MNSESNFQIEDSNLIENRGKSSQRSEQKLVNFSLFKQEADYLGEIYYINPKMKDIEKESSDVEAK
jgi:hypothetical protein